MNWTASQAARGLFSCLLTTARARVSSSFVLAAALGAFLTCLPAPAHAAGTVHLAWDANTETDVVGYVIYYRSEDNQSVGSVRVPVTPTTADLPNLRSGQRYFFSVAALNAEGQSSFPSNEVSGIVDGAIDPPANPNVPTTIDGGVNTYFAEGAAGDIFKYRLALLNTTATNTQALVQFLREGDTPVARVYAMPAHTRYTISASDIPELTNRSFGAIVTAIPGVVAERTMSWDSGGDMSDATTAKALVAPSTTWYLAEGNAGFFDTFLLLVNPSGTATATASIDFLTQDGHVVHLDRQVLPNQRFTVYANEIPELAFQSFGTTIRSDSPILVERAMYFRNSEPMFVGGAASGAVPSGATHWFLAEGQSGGFFSTFILVSNPNSSPVDLTVRFLTAGGVARQDTITLGATQRLTLNLNDYPELANSDVSTDISASGPIVAERTMYWPNNPGPWYGSHNSAGLTELAANWGLAEGEIGGAGGAMTYVLLANPGTADANVTLTYYRENGLAPLSTTRTVPAGSRLTVDSGGVGLSDGERFGVVVNSSQPIAVERSVYWNTGGQLWGSGTNETGTKLP
jgi:hypothetical protein